MIPSLNLFGLPPFSKAAIYIKVFVNGNRNHRGRLVFEGRNNNTGEITNHLNENIAIGTDVTIVLMSSGIVEYNHRFNYAGGDISHVPFLKKENNTDNKSIKTDWNLDYWKTWNPKNEHDSGVQKEKEKIRNRVISIEPIWSSYYADSHIDYFEKFQKLWIGFNAYASHINGTFNDKKKVLALVNTNLKSAFYEQINSLHDEASTIRWEQLQTATGLNMTSNILRDEIARNCSAIDFLIAAKNNITLFSDIEQELNGFIHLRERGDNNVYDNIFRKYHSYMASADGITRNYNLVAAYLHPWSPKSIKRYGGLIFHDPFEDNSEGSLFKLDDYFAQTYASSPYIGQRDQQLKNWEETDPLFFRYLHILYKFRCALFHGDLPPNNSNNELAKTAYLSLRVLFSAIQ